MSPLNFSRTFLCPTLALSWVQWRHTFLNGVFWYVAFLAFTYLRENHGNWSLHNWVIYHITIHNVNTNTKSLLPLTKWPQWRSHKQKGWPTQIKQHCQEIQDWLCQKLYYEDWKKLNPMNLSKKERARKTTICNDTKILQYFAPKANERGDHGLLVCLGYFLETAHCVSDILRLEVSVG